MHARYETDFLQLLHLLPSSYFSDSIEVLQSSVTFQLMPEIICTYCWYYKNNTDNLDNQINCRSAYSQMGSEQL